MTTSKQPDDTILKEFLSFDRKARYTFDSKRDSTETELCRQGSEACITLGMNSRRLFTAMQEQGFFCALPSNFKDLHMECRPLETA